jgi:hypothetical protein
MLILFTQFIHIDAHPDEVISTYTGQFERTEDNPCRLKKSYHLFVRLPTHLVVVADCIRSLCTCIHVCHVLFRLRIQLRDLIMPQEQLV